MIAVIKGDIINSRGLKNPEKWIKPLKSLLNTYGKTPKQWELVWGDFFQLELSDPLIALSVALKIKSLIKSIPPQEKDKNISTIDVRLSIGIGIKEYSGARISESNGQAFIYAGEKFEELQKEKVSIGIKTPKEDFNEEMNLYLKLAASFMDKWSVSSGELINVVLENPDATQSRIGNILGIKQNSVSGRWSRANTTEILEVERMYRKKISTIINGSSH